MKMIQGKRKVVKRAASDKKKKRSRIRGLGVKMFEVSCNSDIKQNIYYKCEAKP